jgi:hypothetical protein
VPLSSVPRNPRTLLGLEEDFLGCLALMMKTLRYLQKSVLTYKSTKDNIPEHRCETLKPHNIIFEDDTGTGDTASDWKGSSIAVSMKLTWNEPTSKSGLPLVRSMVDKPQAQQCELPLWSSHSIRV